MAANTGSQVWSPFKELFQTVDSAIHRRIPDAIQDLEVILRKHKTDFISLLKNPSKNPTHREAVKNAYNTGIIIQGQQSTQLLSKHFIEEALILSDLFDLNEFSAVELLLAGESQQPYFPGLPRGLVAVLLYYDGRVSVVNSLRTLLQARDGRTWTLGLSDELVLFITKFTDSLIAEGLSGKVLELISGINVGKELDQLQKDRALGNARHRKQVRDLVRECHQSLADCIFCWACQTPLNRSDTLALVSFLQRADGMGPDGKLDPVTMSLLMALFYCFDIRLLDQEDAEEVIHKLPLIADANYLQEVHREVNSDHKWKDEGLKSVTQMAWSLTLRTLSQYNNVQDMNDIFEDDESLMDKAINCNVFFYLQDSIIDSDVFHKEEFYIRQIHNMLADFIVHMPLKVKELRNRGDETARVIMQHQMEGLEPTQKLCRNFEHLLNLIGALYEKDPLNLELSLEFWCPAEMNSSPGATGFMSAYQYRPPQRQVSLYKFVRHAGDLLPPSLFIPYINMLTGLSAGMQAAQQCFGLLKTNGLMAAGQGALNTVSWDHFFASLSQYYTSLRQEVPTAGSQAFQGHARNITPQEVDGLISVLSLVRMVADQSETARLALCENQQWVPVVSILGLVGCSVPPNLKSALFKTLAAFAKSSVIALSLWNSLEVSQILPTINIQSGQQPGGIQVELDEVEARAEEFPMIRGFLEMMDSLTDIPVPLGLGAGYRAPGFEPYLDFIKNSVFLKFNSRAYKDEAEKWQVAELALNVFYKMLSEHDPQAEDFVDLVVELQGGGSTTANKPAGHVLLLNLLSDSNLLKMVLGIIDEAVRLLDRYADFRGKDHLEKSSLLCLKLIETTLEKQEQFLSILRDGNQSVIVSQMDQLLLSINPRTGRPDHFVNIAKYVTYNNILPEHALCAVKVLCWGSQSPHAQPELVGLFTSEQTLSLTLLHGFVECLEVEDPEEASPQDYQDEDISTSQLRNATRQNIMRLLLHTITQPAPNIAHFLLGYELRKPVNKTMLEDPGVEGSPRTCLHSVLSLLDRGVGLGSGPGFVQITPLLNEQCYHLVYLLCANIETSSPTLRYLRSAHDFLYRHLANLRESYSGSFKDTAILSQQSWLLKSVALELKLTSANRQRSHTQRLMVLLLDDNPAQQAKILRPDGTFEPDFLPFEESNIFSTTQSQLLQTMTGGQSRRKILQLLDSISFAHGYPDSPQLKFFDQNMLEQFVKACEYRTPDGAMLCNTRLLHRLLMQELNNLQGISATGQKHFIVEEIQNICSNAVDRNATRQAMMVTKQAFDSWRQVVEVIFTACPHDLLPGETRQNILFEIVQDLLQKVSDDEALPELSAPAAGVLLTLLADLYHGFVTDQSHQNQVQDLSKITALLDGAPVGVHGSNFTNEMSTSGRSIFSSALQVVLKGLVEHIMRTSSGAQRIRANLYGALLYYLQIAHKPTSFQALDIGVQERGVVSQLAVRESEFERLNSENLNTLASYGDNLMEVICRDACDGHDVGRMLALATLDSIIAIDQRQLWLTYMTSKGYLEFLVKSLVQDNEQLESVLSPNPEPLKALYIYESKMSLLTKVAQTATGAHTLLHAGLMQRLAECSVYDLRPDYDRPQETGFVPSVMQRYRQLLFPALKLSLSILTSLGIEHQNANMQVLGFINTHFDVFMSILRDRHATLHHLALEELALTTAVVGRAAVDDGQNDLKDTLNSADVQFRSQIQNLQRRMICLFPRYCLSDSLLQKARGMAPESVSGVHSMEEGLEGVAPTTSNQPSAAVLAVEEISANLTAFCRNLLVHSGPGKLSTLLFAPSLEEALGRDVPGRNDYQQSISSILRPPSLGIVVYALRQASNLFTKSFDAHKQTVHKLSSVSQMSAEELKELCGDLTQEKISNQQRQQTAIKNMLQNISHKNQELQHLVFIIENCLFILWRHLDFYLVHCAPSSGGTSLVQHVQKQQQCIRKLYEVSLGSQGDAFDTSMEGLSFDISRDDLIMLKQHTVSCINETLLKTLQEIDMCYIKKRSRYGFLEALIRRLKRLVKLHTGISS